jgi:hypothetical protein
MAILTKAQLEALNQSSFPDQSTEAITPAILRNYNTQTIDTLVDSLDTGSFTTDAEFNAFTSSTNSSITQLNASSASQQISIDALNTTSASLNTSASLALTTASFSGNTLTFTKGNGTTFGVVIPDVSGSTLPSGLLSSSVTNFTDYSASVDSRINAITSSGGIPAGTVSSSAQITSLGFVSSSVTASSLVTASFSGNTLTFTKGDASTFGVVIPDVSGSAGTTIYEVVYTGENITKGDPLYISGSQGANPIVFKADAADPNKMPVTFVSNETIAVANTTNAIVLGLIEGINLTGYTAGQSIYVAEGGGWSLNLPSGSNSVTQLLGVVTKGGSGGKGLVLNPGPAQLPGLDTGKLWVGNGSNQPTEISSASFATTGSNTFIGNQTLSDESGNDSTISAYSGSFVLVAKGVTSGSAGLSNITSSANLVNLIFKNTNANSGSLTISGSNNILLPSATPTAGFRRQVTSNNIFLTTALPEVTGSLTYSPNITGNYGNNIIRFRGPASSSAWSLSANIVNSNLNIGNADTTSANQAIAGGNIASNILLASVNYNAYTTPLVAQAVFQSNLSVGNSTLTAFSSSIAANNNIFVGNTFTVNNRYFGTSSTNAAQRLSLQNNVFGGLATPTLTAAGSNTSAAAPREVHGNTTNGSQLAIGVVLDGDNSNLYSTLIHGSNLTVTGSNAYNTPAGAGSAFFGRNNSVNGTAARSGETIFAVGTGINNGAGRKTGFLIDSGSNTFVEGTLNVSGSTSFTGSAPTILSSSFSGSLITNLTDIYTDIPAVQQIVTLTSASYAGLVSSSLVDPNTLYVVSGSTTTTINTGSFATTGSNIFVGTQTITGSAIGNVISMSVTSNTASMDFNLGNYFVLTASVSPIRIEVSNLSGGITSTLSLLATTGSTITFSSNVQQPSGSAYTASVSGSNDILSFVAFNSSKVNVVSTLKMI